jgi:hypothetical protein
MNGIQIPIRENPIDINQISYGKPKLVDGPNITIQIGRTKPAIIIRALFSIFLGTN